jgi:hypothetical protein
LRECVVADAVDLEPVSSAQFPANREINREFRRIRPLSAILKADTRANSEASSEFPTRRNREFLRKAGNLCRVNREFSLRKTKSVFGTYSDTRPLRADFVGRKRALSSGGQQLLRQGDAHRLTGSRHTLIRVDCRLIHTKSVLARGWSALGQGVGPEFGPESCPFRKRHHAVSPVAPMDHTQKR